MSKYFTESLLEWFQDGARSLPWKNSKDPYLIWISEIILQQTRVNQGTPYFLKFINKFPTVRALASASEDEVMKIWEGLGYYSRARNLHFSAKYIVNELDGVFPESYESLLKLKGVGPYTAAAIASFAYDLPYAVADGNVYRIITRFYGIKEPVDDVKVKRKINNIVSRLMPFERPADFNQAMMDFGATICTPDNPLCLFCPLQSECRAFSEGQVKMIPYKAKKIVRRDRFLHYIVVEKEQHILIKKRLKGIWKGLYDLPGVEAMKEGQIDIFDCEKVRFIYKTEHLLTHQKLHIYFYIQKLNTYCYTEPYLKIKKEKWCDYSFPKPIQSFLKDLF